MNTNRLIVYAIDCNETCAQEEDSAGEDTEGIIKPKSVAPTLSLPPLGWPKVF